MTETYSLDASSILSFAGASLVLDASDACVTSGSDSAVLEHFLTHPEFLRILQIARANTSIVTEQLSGVVNGETVHLDVTLLPASEGKVVVLGRNVTLENSLRSALVDSRQRFKDLVEISSDFAWEIGGDGRFVFVSPRGAIGYRADELVGSKPDDFILRRSNDSSITPFLNSTRIESEEVWLLRPDGEPACLLVSCIPLIDEEGNWVGSRGVCRDVTVERERDAALARAYHRDQLLAYIVKTVRDEVLPENMLGTAANAIARALGANGCRIFRKDTDDGYVVAARFGETPEDSMDNAARFSHMQEGDVTENTGEDWREMFSATHYHREVNGAICLYRSPERGDWSDDDRILISDVANQLGIANEQIANHERIVKLSRTDALTGLLNRRAFLEEEIPRRIQRLERDGSHAALVYVDLDNFKLVNDAFGHQRGDEVLLYLRDFLYEYTRPGDVVARLGGDEFAVWYDGMDSDIASVRAADLVNGASRLGQFSASREFPLSLSVGVAVYTPGDGEALEDLISRADEAMYEAKHGGKNSFRISGKP